MIGSWEAGRKEFSHFAGMLLLSTNSFGVPNTARHGCRSRRCPQDGGQSHSNGTVGMADPARRYSRVRKRSILAKTYRDLTRNEETCYRSVIILAAFSTLNLCNSLKIRFMEGSRTLCLRLPKLFIKCNCLGEFDIIGPQKPARLLRKRHAMAHTYGISKS